jgi:hypothetical protein
MRVKSIAITLLILAALMAVYVMPCYAAEVTLPNVNQLFDMSPSAWTTSTYPAFMNTASGAYMYNAQAPTLPTVSGTDLGKLSSINYSPVFDMSPGAFSFSTYPTFTDSGQLTNADSDLGVPMISAAPMISA